ncbi:MAG: helix-turn-helix domain-containing protein [Eubacteriales bacterium]
MARGDKSSKIIEAASKVFYLAGFDGTKMEEIAKEAGIGKGTVYEYFDSKQHLFDEMVKYKINERISIVKELMEVEGTLRDKIFKMVKYQIEFMKNHINIFNVMKSSSQIAQKPEMGLMIFEHNLKVFDIVKEQLTKAQEMEEISRTTNVDVAAGLIIGTINQFCMKQIIHFGIIPKEKDMQEVVDAIFYGIAVQDNRT